MWDSQNEIYGPAKLRHRDAAMFVFVWFAVIVAVCCVGCGSTETVSPEISDRAAELSSGASFQKAIDDHAKALATTLAAQKLTGEMTLENTQAIMAKLNTLEASLVKSASQQTGGDPKASPEPPAKANTAATPSKVATPGAFRTASDGTVLRWNVEGNWNPTILETSAHLGKEHGINTDGMTHQEMADIHAALHEGKPVATKANPVQFVTRGSSCPGGVCPAPQRVSRRARR